MDVFATWLRSTNISWAINAHFWIWPTCETLHFIGLCLLIGNVGLLDLRILGMGKRLPPAPINRLVLWGVFGFAINLATGVTFFIGEPAQYIHNVAFQLKVLFIVLAAANLATFYVSGINRKVAALGAGEDAPLPAKVMAATSLFLWVGVMYWGRMLPYVGNAF